MFKRRNQLDPDQQAHELEHARKALITSVSEHPGISHKALLKRVSGNRSMKEQLIGELLESKTVSLDEEDRVRGYFPGQDAIDTTWREYLVHGRESEFRYRHILGLLPSNPRCKLCNVPFQGPGGSVARHLFNRRPSKLNPRMCNECEEFGAKYQGGAEVELSLMFADVRGSTTIAEGMTPTEFGKLIDRFYKATSKVLIQSDAIIDKIIGDQVSGMYVPGFVGPNHAMHAIEAAREVLAVTGHGDSSEPWIPLGAGVHTGVAYVGAVGASDGTSDITVLGDAPNTAARLSSSAAIGEILVSEATSQSAGLSIEGLERRALNLKGKTEPVIVHVMNSEASVRQTA